MKIRKPKKSKFDLSYHYQSSTQFGTLVPFMVKECVPGDTFNVSTQSFVRLAPMISPIFGHVSVKQEYFFVPMRLLWKGFSDAITGGVDGMANADFPTFTGGDFPAGANSAGKYRGSLADYFGIPENVNDDCEVNALPFIAYQKIYYDWYVNENFEAKNTDDMFNDTCYLNNASELSLKTANILQIRQRNLRKDYFTASLPWVQRGPQVTLDFNPEITFSADGKPSRIVDVDADYKSADMAYTGTSMDAIDLTVTPDGNLNVPQRGKQNVAVDNSENLSLSSSLISINDLRRSTAVQRWLERNARAGSRYIEQILSHFGVRTPDYRLQRSEFIGSSSQVVQVSEVLQTSQSTDKSALGEYAGHGIAAGIGRNTKYYCNEFGYIIGIFSIVPEVCYSQGIDRQFLHNSRFDFYFPEFANLGEQPVYQAEIWAKSADPKKAFGYNPRYQEYRTSNNMVTGDLRTGGMSSFVLQRKFDSQPHLNKDFVRVNPTEYDNIFAVSSEVAGQQVHHFLLDLYVSCIAKRPMPRYALPHI